jgi:hypothetical protein
MIVVWKELNDSTLVQVPAIRLESAVFKRVAIKKLCQRTLEQHRPETEEIASHVLSAFSKLARPLTRTKPEVGG